MQADVSQQLQSRPNRSWAFTDYNLEKRKAEAERIRQKYPDRIPVRIDPWDTDLDWPFLSIAESLVLCCSARIARLKGHMWKDWKIRHRYYRQEEIPRPSRSDSRSIRLCNQKTNQAVSRKGNLYLCRWSPSTDCCAHVEHLRRTQRRGRFPLCWVFWREYFWAIETGWIQPTFPSSSSLIWQVLALYMVFFVFLLSFLLSCCFLLFSISVPIRLGPTLYHVSARIACKDRWSSEGCLSGILIWENHLMIIIFINSTTAYMRDFVMPV